ncbi:zinc carboxypeptidase A 1-like isoform X2 [Battus philenor]|uniref:zinc carboxypeptidase A 1-like isoform X2 n=1 Tax=Battus philenor TaxID=42288 RepID=UPI0035CF7E14
MIKMKITFITACFSFAALIHMVATQYCGCKDMNRCYLKMLKTLLSDNEEPCIEHAEIGSTSVLLKHPVDDAVLRNIKPVILLEAGQQAGIEPVTFALYIIEQLVACKEHINLLKNARWVILPNTNPDGREFSRYHTASWKKNFRVSEEDQSVGVDISRNFDESFSDCPKVLNGFSPEYPGKKPMSENETMFITRVLNKYKSRLRAYVSIRRDGHALLYPFGSNHSHLYDTERLKKRAAEIVSKINHKFGFIELLTNSSIYDMNRKPHCGHSVDFVFAKYDQPYAYEMRVFLETDHRIMTKFQTLPRGYDTTLRIGYFGVIKELYNAVVAEYKNKTGGRGNR